MIRALIYLRLASLSNRLSSMLRRLREPKYLMGAAVGGAYLYFLVIRRQTASGSMALTPLFGAIAVLALLAGRLVFAWLSPEENPGLRFSEAEICFLFPAPVTRRMIIQYNLLSALFSIVVSSLCLTFIYNRWAAGGGTALRHLVGTWVILSAVNLLFVGTPLAVAKLGRFGIGAAPRRAAVLGAIVLVLSACAIPVWNRLHAPTAAEVSGTREFIAYASGLLDVGPLHWLLLVLKAVFRPLLAPGWRSFLPAMGPALGVLAVQYVWVIRMETSFEEGSIALAGRSARFLAARREGRLVFSSADPKARREPFRLAARGRPETAFLWKNLISAWSGFKLRTLFLAAGAIFLCCRGLERHTIGPQVLGVVLSITLLMAGYTLLLGPQYARQDLRSDLSNADILKTYPLPGWQIVLGELLAPTAILGGLWWLELLTIGLCMPEAGPSAWLPAGLRLPFLLALGVVAPLVSALQLLAPNATALLFPGWIQSPRNKGPGIDFFGQRMIFMFGQILATAVSILPAALAAGIIYFASSWVIGMAAAVLLGTAAAAVIILGELWIGIWWLGERFEGFDAGAEMRQ